MTEHGPDTTGLLQNRYLLPKLVGKKHVIRS
jgi:hypothetical protein